MQERIGKKKWLYKFHPIAAIIWFLIFRQHCIKWKMKRRCWLWVQSWCTSQWPSFGSSFRHPWSGDNITHVVLPKPSCFFKVLAMMKCQVSTSVWSGEPCKTIPCYCDTTRWEDLVSRSIVIVLYLFLIYFLDSSPHIALCWCENVVIVIVVLYSPCQHSWGLLHRRWHDSKTSGSRVWDLSDMSSWDFFSRSFAIRALSPTRWKSMIFDGRWWVTSL
jgi:hypothetical protein